MAAILVAVAVGSCRGDGTLEPAHAPPALSEGGGCANNAGSTQNVWKHWTCGANVYLNVSSLSSGDRSVIEGAANAWNALLHDRYSQLPRFTTDPAVAPKDFTITVTATAPSMSTWCGGVSPAGSGRPTALTVGTIGGKSGCGQPSDVALHELAHIAGFGADWHTPGEDLLEHCAVALIGGTTNTVNTHQTPCQWEVEVMLALYGVRSAAPDFTKHIVTRLVEPSGPLSLEVPQTGTMTFGKYQFDRSNGLLCGLTSRDMCLGEDAPSLTRTGSLAWSSSAPSVATVTPTGGSTTLTAVSAGTTVISAAALPVSSYEIGVGAGGQRSLTVTVPPPPPSPPDAEIVGNYTSETHNVRSSQTCSFMAFPSGGTYTWRRQNQGSAIWKTIGTSREVSLLTGTVDFTLELTVTLNGLSDTAYLAVDVSSSGVLCDGY